MAQKQTADLICSIGCLRLETKLKLLHLLFG